MDVYRKYRKFGEPEEPHKMGSESVWQASGFRISGNEQFRIVKYTSASRVTVPAANTANAWCDSSVYRKYRKFQPVGEQRLFGYVPRD